MDLKIDKLLENINDTPERIRIRKISFFSAAIAKGENGLIKELLNYLKVSGFDSRAIYETILQSYLFLGFPRMIEASICHAEIMGNPPETYQSEFSAVSLDEGRDWFNRGVELCRTVYGKNYERLKKSFESMSPEIFRWMVIEGYGKVLTRPGLNSIERELAEVAALIVDRRERQLLSHVIGSLNVGSDLELIKTVNRDIEPIAGEEAGRMANRIIDKVAAKYADKN